MAEFEGGYSGSFETNINAFGLVLGEKPLG